MNLIGNAAGRLDLKGHGFKACPERSRRGPKRSCVFVIPNRFSGEGSALSSHCDEFSRSL
jgi:hypothetical protein